MSLAVFVGAAVVFAVIPRVGIGFLSGTFRRRVNIVGFSDEVTLGHHGVISGDNQTVVLWVRYPKLEQIKSDDMLDRTISQFYWRGTVYDTYHNGQWVRSRRPETTTGLVQLPASDGGTLYWLNSPEGPVNKERRFSEQQLAPLDEQEIHVVGLSHPVAFALDEPVAFRAPVPPPGSFVSVGMQARYGGEVGLRLVRSTGLPGASVKEFSGARYLAYSRQLYGRMPYGFGRPTAELQATGMLSSYLMVPKSMSPRVAELARTITEGKIGPMAKALAIVEWLQKTHRYTTDLRRNPSVADPLEDFLFHQDAGHCEYFASATAVLLRLAGVPSRYVNGFLGGEWNDLGKYLTIRDNRAHSWAEAYLGPAGWVRIDATPMANTGSHMGRLKQLVDSVEFFWSRWVIDYDVSRQIDIAKRIGRGVGVAKGHVDFAHLKRVLRWAALGLLLGAVAVVVVRRLRARRWGTQPRGQRAAGRRRSGPRIYKLYETVLARLARRGWTRGSAETPREFAHRLTAAQVPAAEALAKLTEHYGAARFGDRDIPDQLVAELERAAEELGRGTPPPPLPPPPSRPPAAAQPPAGP